MGSAISTVWRKLHEPRVHLTVEPVLFLFMFASFLSYTLFQELVHHLVCEQTDNCSSNASSETHSWNGTARGCNEPSSTEQLVQTRSSHWLLYINLATGLPSVLVSVFYGSISDQKGRRPFIILPAVGTILNQVVILLTVYFHNSLPLSFLLLGAFASGVCGSYSVVNFAVYSYASDVSAQSKRTLQISVLESMTYLGATASLVIGGLWVSSGHYAGPLLCIIAINVAIIAYTIVGVPESLGAFHRDDDSGRSPRQSLDMCQLVKAACRSLLSFIRLLTGTWRLVVLILMFLVVEINFLGITDTVILFALGEPLCWGPELIGYFLAAKVLLNGVATLFVLPALSYCGVRDTTVLVVGLVAGASSLTLMGFATHTWLMFVGEWVQELLPESVKLF